MAVSAMPTLTVKTLARLYRTTTQLLEGRDQEHRQHVLIVSALLELLGGQAVLPEHALQNASGYQSRMTTNGDLMLQSEAITRKTI